MLQNEMEYDFYSSIEFEERKLGNGWTKEQLLESAPGAMTVPQIILDGKLIGGYEQLKTALQD